MISEWTGFATPVHAIVIGISCLSHLFAVIASRNRNQVITVFCVGRHLLIACGGKQINFRCVVSAGQINI